MNRTVLILLLILGTIASTHLLPFQPIVGYAGTKIVSSILFLVMAFFLFRTPMEPNTLRAMVILFVILRFSFIFMHPVGSDDIFRYLWDGKVQAFSINPYLFAPNASELAHLQTGQLPALINQPHMPTMYFPLSEWIFYLAYLIGGVHFFAYKSLLFIAEMITLFGLIKTLELRNIDRKYLLLFFACPLMIFEYSIDAHVDLFGLMFLILFLHKYLEGKLVTALVFLACSFSVKPAALIMLPVLFFHGRTWKERITILILPFALLAAQFLPYLFDGDIFVSLRAFTRHWTFNGFFFNLFNLYFHNNQPARITAALFLLIVVIAINFTKYPVLEKIYYSVLALLLFSPVVHPWYIGWVGILVPLVRKPSGIYLIAAAGLTVLTPLQFQLEGIWKDHWEVLIIEYVPVLMLLGYEFRHRYREIMPSAAPDETT